MRGPRDEAAFSLVIIPPPEDWAQFVAIKRKHMNPRIKRPPFPHITMLGKLSADEIERITKVVSEHGPFELEIGAFKVFENKKNTTLYLDPKEIGEGFSCVFVCLKSKPRQ